MKTIKLLLYLFILEPHNILSCQNKPKIFASFQQSEAVKSEVALANHLQIDIY